LFGTKPNTERKFFIPGCNGGDCSSIQYDKMLHETLQYSSFVEDKIVCINTCSNHAARRVNGHSPPVDGVIVPSDCVGDGRIDRNQAGLRNYRTYSNSSWLPSNLARCCYSCYVIGIFLWCNQMNFIEYISDDTSDDIIRTDIGCSFIPNITAANTNTSDGTNYVATTILRTNEEFDYGEITTIIYDVDQYGTKYTIQ
jgi:hypothetical protein